MKYLRITNTGMLDARLIPLMGGTTKANDEFKIGQFGTGLKYALAYLLRENVHFTLHTSGECVPIDVVLEEIAGEEYGIITIHGEKTSITTNMGKEWEPWMIVRELWCNALDEGGCSVEVVDGLKIPEDDQTCFHIQLVGQFVEVWQNWTDYFIHDIKPLEDNKHFAVYPNGNKPMRLYKNGVLIWQASEKHSVFHYDIKTASINELREFLGSARSAVTSVLPRLGKDAVEYYLEHIKDEAGKVSEKLYDTDVDFMYTYHNMGQAWQDALGSAKIITQKAIEEIQARGLDIDLAGVVPVPHNLYRELTKSFKGIGALRTADKINEFFEVHNPEAQQALNAAFEVLDSVGYDYAPDPELKWVIGVFGDKDTVARIRVDEKTVFLSEAIQHKSLFDNVTTVVEEVEHFNTGLQDCSRAFQQHFINLYVKTLLKEKGVAL